VRLGTFRQDLYWRLDVYPIRIPPLRERRDDIAALAYHFLRRFAESTGKEVEQFSTAALEALTRYDWPGNVRQLENVVERSVVGTRLKAIDLVDLPDFIAHPSTNSTPTTDNLAALERATIARVLAETGHNLYQAAKRLGISRTTLYSKIRKHKLE
jgi:transcriptional regulator with PAS, ATPase and Fis domain